MLCRYIETDDGRSREIVARSIEMKRKQAEPELETAIEVAEVEFEIARTLSQRMTSAKASNLKVAKLKLKLRQTKKKAQQTTSTSTKEREDQEGPKFPESSSKAALQTQQVVERRSRKLVPSPNTAESSQARKGKSRQGTQSVLPTRATKLSPTPRCQDKDKKKPTLKPAPHSQKSKKKAISDQSHTFTNRPKEVAKVPNYQISATFGERMEAFMDALTKREEINSEKINKLEISQDTNAKSLEILTDKVIDMSEINQTVTESLQRTDTVMTMVHKVLERAESADNKHEDLSRKVTTMQEQQEEMVQNNKELNKKVNQLQKDTVKKGQKSQVRRVQQSPTPPPPPAPVAQVNFHLFQPSVQPGSSSGVTFTSRWAPAINDLRYDNQNFQGLHIVREEHSDLLLLKPPEAQRHRNR